MNLKRTSWLGLITALALIAGLCLWHSFTRPRNRQTNGSPPMLGATRAQEPGLNRKGSTSTESAPIPPLLKEVLDAQLDYRIRIAAVRRLTSTNLTEMESMALQQFLLRPAPADAEQNGQAFKNQLLDRLCALKPLPSWLAETLVQMYRDRAQDDVIRDYAIQHLPALYEQLQINGQDDPLARRLVQDGLWEAAADTDSSIGGTALLGLTRLAAENPEFDRARIARAALQVAGDAGANELSRITAFQVGARLAPTEAEPLLVQVVSSTESLPMRISAVGALGVVGDPQLTALLSNLANGTEPRLKLPAQQALNHLQSAQKQTAKTKS